MFWLQLTSCIDCSTKPRAALVVDTLATRKTKATRRDEELVMFSSSVAGVSGNRGVQN